MPYTYEIFDLLLVGGALTAAVTFLAVKGELFKGW
jgi:hypothetical protein